MDGGGNEFAENHIIPVQVGQKQQAEGAFALFFTKAIRGEKNSGQQSESKCQNAKGDK